MKRAATIILVLVLLAAGVLRLGHLASHVGLNADEQAGIGEARDIPLSELLLRGPPVEVNPSPLNYLLDRAWLQLNGGDPHRRYNLNLFFRVLPMLYFTVGTILLALLCLQAATALGLPFVPSLLTALVIGIFFQSNEPGIRHAAISDRPYALFYLLSCVQLWQLFRSPPAPSWKLGVTHFLLCFNSFGAAMQVAAGVLVRAALGPRDRKTLLRFTAETVPAAAVALWYWYGAPRMHTHSPDQRGLVDLWLEAAGNGVLAPNASYYGGSAPGWLAGLCGILLIAATPLAMRSFRTLRWAVPLSVALAIPVTWVALHIAKSLQPRYFVFLLPAMGLAHVFAVLALAAKAKETLGRSAVAGAFLLAWSAGQLAYRYPALKEELLILRGMPLYALRVEEPLSSCPAELGAFRIGPSRGASPGDVDTARLQKACLPLQRTEP